MITALDIINTRNLYDINNLDNARIYQFTIACTEYY